MAVCSARESRGFTLVELLVALAILSLLLTAAFGSLSVGSRSWERSLDRAEATQNLRRSVDFLRRQFAHLTPVSLPVDRVRRIAFDGGPDRVRFIAPAPEASGGGLVVVTLAVDRTGDDVAVWFGVAPVDPGRPTALDVLPAYRRPLLAELSDATIGYFGTPKIDDEAAWHREWLSDADRFPSAVRLLSAAKDGTAPPDFSFRIRAEEPL